MVKVQTKCYGTSVTIRQTEVRVWLITDLTIICVKIGAVVDIA